MDKHAVIIGACIAAIVSLIVVHSMELKWREEIQDAKSEEYENGFKYAVGRSEAGIIIDRYQNGDWYTVITCEGRNMDAIRMGVIMSNSTWAGERYNSNTGCYEVIIYGQVDWNFVEEVIKSINIRENKL